MKLSFWLSFPQTARQKRPLRDSLSLAMVKSINRKKVFLAMSGGVDSSVAAVLLKNRGYDVFGVFFNLGQKNCASSVRDAKKAAQKIGVPLKVIDLRKQFKKEVIDYFFKGYEKGITPNPCVKCNKYIKFGAFLKRARKQGADYIATGHYAKIRSANCRKLKTQNEKGKTIIGNLKFFKIYRAKDKKKDQSYFLWMLNQNQLKYCLFPLGNYTKQEVREIARKSEISGDAQNYSDGHFRIPRTVRRGLCYSDAKESQDVCFVKDADKHGLKKGKILNTNGEIIGEHEGVAFYTVGQRKGLDIASENPHYVVKIDAKKNIVVAGEKKDCFVSEFLVKNANWICPPKFFKSKFKRVNEKPKNRSSVFVKIRSQQKLNSAKITFFRKGLIKIKTKKPIWAPAPGQSAVFYLKSGEMLGGGDII